MLINDFEHPPRLEMFEARPPEIFIRLAALIIIIGLRTPVEAFRKDAPFDRPASVVALRSSSSCISSRRLMRSGRLSAQSLAADWRGRQTRNRSRFHRSGCATPL